VKISFSMERDHLGDSRFIGAGRSLRRPGEAFLTQETTAPSTGRQDPRDLRNAVWKPRVLPYIAVAGCLALFLVSCGAEPQTRVIDYNKTLERPASGTWDGKVLTATLPEGWIPEPVFGMRDESFRVVGSLGQESEVTVTALPVSGGTVESNALRWANQVGMEGAGTETITIDGLQGVSVTLIPESGDGNTDSLAIVGVILEDGETRRFIKFSGPASVLREEEANWEKFLAAISWKEGR
jgi:hypothetical protein